LFRTTVLYAAIHPPLSPTLLSAHFSGFASGNTIHDPDVYAFVVLPCIRVAIQTYYRERLQ
jgi:hypothetical protein